MTATARVSPNYSLRERTETFTHIPKLSTFLYVYVRMLKNIVTDQIMKLFVVWSSFFYL